MTLTEFITNFDFSTPNWENLPKDFPDCDLGNLTSEQVGQFLAIKNLWQLNKKQIGSSGKPPVNSRILPFRIPTIEKTTRQAQSTQGYKASAHWQTASLLRDLVHLYLPILAAREFRRRTQLDDAARSLVATIEEGWARPSTREYLDYLGFSQASLAEIRGDVERMHTDGILKSGIYQIKSPSPNFPYPPVRSRHNPSEYGNLRERLREYTGREIKPGELTLELFNELVNKTDYLLTKAVFGLQEKVIREEKEKFAGKVRSSWKPWKK